MPIPVRRATPADAAVLVEFNRRLALETEDVVLDLAILERGVEAGLADLAKALYYVACQGEDVVGQLMITREWSDWRNGWMWWIQSVYVLKEARGRGVFRALYEYVHAIALADPEVIGLRLYVEHENSVAQQTYRSLGMDQTAYLVFERCPL